MNHLRRVEQNYYSSFQPSAYSGGIQPYQPPGAAYYGEMSAGELRAQNSFPDTHTLAGYVTSLDNYSVTTLSNINSLQKGAFMQVVAGNNAEAYLKAAYWLKVAWLGSGELKVGWLTSLTSALQSGSSLKSASDGMLSLGITEGEKSGSLYNSSMVVKIYSDALRALQSEKDAFTDNQATYDSIVEILKAGTNPAAVVAARAQQEESRDIEHEGGEQAECESSWLSFIPGYCENRFLFKVIGGAVMTTIGLFAARGVYKQVVAFKREVEK